MALALKQEAAVRPAMRKCLGAGKSLSVLFGQIYIENNLNTLYRDPDFIFLAFKQAESDSPWPFAEKCMERSKYFQTQDGGIIDVFWEIKSLYRFV